MRILATILCLICCICTQAQGPYPSFSDRICDSAYVRNTTHGEIIYVSDLNVTCDYEQTIERIVGNNIYISGSHQAYVNCPLQNKVVEEPLGFLSDGEYTVQHHIARNVFAFEQNELVEKTIKDTTCYVIFRVADGKIVEKKTLPEGRRWVMREYRPLYPAYGERKAYFEVKGDTVINDNRYSIVVGDSDNRQFIRYYGTEYFCYSDKLRGDILVFDESWNVGDATIIGDGNPSTPRYTVAETGNIQGLEYWRIDGVQLRWVQGIGFVNARPFLIEHGLSGGVSLELICCTEANGDTVYVNRDLLYLLSTGIHGTNAGDISIVQSNGECIVTLPDNAKWSATLYSSNGTAVARKAGEGCEIILPAENKGTHILVLNIDGKQYTKKVVIK